MGCATTTIKVASIIFNILLTIISIGGIVCIAINPDYFQEAFSIGYCITLSLCVAFAFLGIFATIRESVCLTATCAVFLLALTCINVAIAVIGISRDLNGVEVVNKAWETDTSIEELQAHHECCGKSSSNDYILINKAIPYSCYLNKDPSDIHNLFTQGCTEKMIKYYEEETQRFVILLWSCVAFELLGIGLIALSIYELNSSKPGTFEHVAIVVQIFVGSFVILTSFMGCIGVCRQSSSLIWSYAMCLALLLIFQIFIIVAAHSTNYVENALNNFNNLWNNYNLNSEQITEMEKKYNCCGKTGSQDYISYGKTIPESCYVKEGSNSNNLLTEPCLESIKKSAFKNGQIGLAIKYTLFFLELCALAFSSLMGINLRHKHRREQFRNETR